MAAGDFAYRIAETREEIEGAVRLVYRNYIELNYCPRNRFEVHFYLYDVLPETRTLVALAGGRVVATLTLVFDSPLGLPSGKLYPAELEALRAGGRRIVEISKLSVDRDLGVRGLSVLKGIFRLAWLTSSRVRAMTDFVIMVEPHHERFYANSLLFERLGELKPDPEAADAPSVLLRLDLLAAPERHRAKFGEEPKPSNPYWYFCLAPEVATTEAAAREADERLGNMNRLLETGRKLPSPTPAERRYMDYRLFSLAFVTDKTCQEAERRARKGLFADEISVYDRLLAALPPDYAPERRASVCLDLSTAAWHCGLYERSLALARAARSLAVGADLVGRSHAAAGLALYFLGRRDEAVQEIRAGLAVEGLPAAVRVELLRVDGRLAIEHFDLAGARQALEEARRIGASLSRSPENDRALAKLFHNLWILETKAGNFAAARQALRTGAPFLQSARNPMLLQYHVAWSSLESAAGRPREALAHAEMGLRLTDPGSDPFNAAVLAQTRARYLLAIGRLDAAHLASEENLKLARSSNFAGVVADALAFRAELALAEDDLPAARRQLQEAAEALGGGLSTRAEMSLVLARFSLARAERNWARAREMQALLEKGSEGVPEYVAYSRYYRALLELLAGNLPEARRLIEGLTGTGGLVGYALFDAGCTGLRAVLVAADGREDEAISLAESCLAIHRAGEAPLALAEEGLLLAEALVACGLRESCPRLFNLARAAAAEALSQARLPACARRLRELQD